MGGLFMKQKLFSESLSIMLSDSVKKQLRDITDERKISISDYAREAINEKLKLESENQKQKKDDEFCERRKTK